MKHQRRQVLVSPALNELFGGPVEVFDSGAQTPQDNMDFDTERALALGRGDALPMLRLYAWRPWAVSLGKHQNEDDIDAARLAERGYEMVRRPTGGRAVFHAEELTYAVTVRLDEGRGPTEIYRLVNERLLDGLQALAEALSYEKSQTDFRKHYSVPKRSLPCFSSSARYEIVFEGRKLVGSAQRRLGNVVLQHGSILLGGAHAELADLAQLDSDAARRAMRMALKKQTATLSELHGSRVDYDAAAAAVLSGFVRDANAQARFTAS